MKEAFAIPFNAQDPAGSGLDVPTLGAVGTAVEALVRG